MERFTLKSKFYLTLIGFLWAGRAWAVVPGLPGATDNPYLNRPARPVKMDRNALREQVDETQALLDSLARETRSVDKKQLEPLFKSLREEYFLGDYVGKARKAVEQAEAVLDVQDAIKAQQTRLKSPVLPDLQKEESKLLGMQSDLAGSVDQLREILRDVHQNANEDNVRDFRNWIMISEGLLRRQREEAEAKALSPGAEAAAVSPVASTPLSAEGLTPQGTTPTGSAALTTGSTATAARPKKKVQP